MNKKITASVVAVAVATSVGIGTSASATDERNGGKQLRGPAPQLSALQGRGVTAQAATATPIGKGTVRLGGGNRWETAEAVSKAFWDYENTFAVALVSGENFPDSLSLPPAAATLGPTLLVQSKSLPAATRAELQRLRPCIVIAAGGTTVISDEVLRAADAYADPTQEGCE